jgi:uncharacterized protein involved in exopolysaccharide biosynthesis
MATQSGPDDTARSPVSALPPGRGDRSADAEEEILDLDWVGRAILRRWLFIFAGAILGGAIAFWFASAQPLRYQGVTTLLVVPPSEPGGAQINPATFRAIVENASLVAQVISELKLDDGERAFTPQKFLDEALVVEEVRGTNIVRVRVALYDRGTAAEASRRLASKAIVLTQQISQQDGASIQKQLANHLGDAEKRRAEAERDLLSYKQGAQVELLKADTDAQLKERGDLLRLVVDIEAEKSRLAAALAEIKRQLPVLSVARMTGVEDALRRADADGKSARNKEDELAGRKPATARGEVDSQHLDLTNPYVNPVYQTLDFQIATSRTRIAALEKERDELLGVKKIGGKELSQLSELYRKQIEQARLQANFDLATRVYSDLSVRYEQSRTQPLGSTAQLQVIDEALPPDRPLSRRRLQYGVFGAATGLLITVLLALVWENRGRQL